MEDELIFVDPEEDEVFFGPISDQEKQISSRYKNRKTLPPSRFEDAIRERDSSSSKRKHVHKLTPYQRPSVSRLSISEISHCSIAEELADDDLPVYEVTSTASRMACALNRMSGLKLLSDIYDTDEPEFSEEDTASINDKINKLTIQTLPNIEIDSDEQPAVLTQDIEEKHSYSTPVKAIIDKTIFNTPKSLVKADLDGGYLTVLSEIAIVKAVEEKDMPEIKITEPTPEKIIENPSPALTIKPDNKKFNLVYHTPEKFECVDVNDKSITEIIAGDLEVTMKIMEEQGNEKTTQSFKEDDADTAPHVEEEGTTAKCASPDNSARVIDESYSEQQLQTQCDKDYSEMGIKCSDTGDIMDASLDLFTATELEKEASKIVYSFQSQDTTDYNFSILDNSFIDTEDKHFLEDSFLQSKSKEQKVLSLKQQELLKEIMNSPKRKGLLEVATTPTKPSTPVSKTPKAEAGITAKQTPKAETGVTTKHTPKAETGITHKQTSKTTEKKTPSANWKARTPLKVKSEQKGKLKESSGKPVATAHASSGKPVATAHASSEKLLARFNRCVHDENRANPTGHFKVPSDSSRIPKLGSVSKVHLSKLPLSTNKTAVQHSTPLKTNPPQKCLSFSKVESPVNAYINYKPVSLMANVKDTRNKSGVSTPEQQESSTKKLWQRKVVTRLENWENQNPNRQLTSQVPQAEYHITKTVVTEKFVESKLPRLATTMRKLMPDKSPKVTKHEGRRRDDVEGDVSVMVSYPVRNTILFK